MPLLKMGIYNDFPEGMLPKIPKTPTTFVYRFNDSYSFKDIVSGKKAWYAEKHIPSISTISGPDGLPIPIALAGGVDQNGNLLHQTIRMIKFSPAAQDGNIFITAGEKNTLNDELYQWFELTSNNGSNPQRDQSAEPIFYRVNFVADADAKLKKLDLEQKAITTILTADKADLEYMANLHGVSANQDAKLIKADLTDVAKLDPEVFLALANDPDKDSKAALAAALANGAVVIDEEKCALVNAANRTVLFSLSQATKEAALDEFAAHVRSDPKGANTVKAIKTLTEVRAKAK